MILQTTRKLEQHPDPCAVDIRDLRKVKDEVLVLVADRPLEGPREVRRVGDVDLAGEDDRGVSSDILATELEAAPRHRSHINSTDVPPADGVTVISSTKPS